MKKTVTITFHSSNNNGSFLQSFALQKKLKNDFSIDNKILDYRSVENQNLYKLFRPIKGVGDIGRSLISLLHYRKLNLRRKRFEHIRQKHLGMTELIENEQDAYAELNKYDIAIAGSDQIWNVYAHDFSNLYFLPDVRGKKVAYAVSCGSKVEGMKLERHLKYIENFDYISMRETKSLKYIDNLIKRDDLYLTVDPTLLLDKLEYRCLYNDNPIINRPYIFLYTIDYNKDVLKQAKRISKLYNMPVITVFTSYHSIICHSYGIKVLYDAGPSEFLNLIDNAEFVITNSFHGTAFSVIFRKNFYHLSSIEEGAVLKDDRINGLLDIIGLDQSISLRSTHEEILKRKSIDYSGMDEKLALLRKNSMNYLSMCLSE